MTLQKELISLKTKTAEHLELKGRSQKHKLVQVWQSLIKINVCLSYHAEILLLGIIFTQEK